MIQAKVIQDSLSPYGDRLTTLEVVMPRYILAEFNTHRILSKNSASSRAIPPAKMRRSVEENPFIPYAWQKEHSGMQGTEYLDELKASDLDNTWIDSLSAKGLLEGFWGNTEEYNGELSALEKAISSFNNLVEHKVTKQLANRLLEPFMYHKVLVSGTEWENFFNLRCPQYDLGDNFLYKSRKETKANTNSAIVPKYDNILSWLKLNKGKADIHMMFLAEAIYDAMNESTPKKLQGGEWHIPYGDNMIEGQLLLHGEFSLLSNKSKDEIVTDLKLKVSTSRCARLSYQTLGDNPEINYEKDLELFNKLLVEEPIHASPAEHPGRAMNQIEYYNNTKSYTVKELNPSIQKQIDKGQAEAKPLTSRELGITGYVVTEFGWCRNFRGFIPYRHILEV